MNYGKRKVDLTTFKEERMFTRFVAEQNPAVCVTGNFDVTNLYRQKKKGHSLNALLCFCILKAAQKVEEFHYSIDENKELYYYDYVKTNAVINGKDGQLYYADYKYYDDFEDFEKEYLKVNDYCSTNCVHFREDTGALIATSAVIGFPFTSFSLDISSTFWDNFLLWGKTEKHMFKRTLNISLRFHHATVHGRAAARFFNELQNQFNSVKTKRR